MPRINKILSGEQDITDEVLDTILVTGINPDILDRFSSLLVTQIHAYCISRYEDPFRICHEILSLEGMLTHGCSNTKPPTMFSRKPYLRGLWHKHYMGVGVPVLAQNLQNSLQKYRIPYLDDLLEESKRTGVVHYLSEDDAKKIAHQVVHEHFNKRTANKEVTGHWIIYAQYGNKNYYLCLARHTDDEAEIRKQIESKCYEEFPFLEKILEKIPE